MIVTDTEEPFGYTQPEEDIIDFETHVQNIRYCSPIGYRKKGGAKNRTIQWWADTGNERPPFAFIEADSGRTCSREEHELIVAKLQRVEIVARRRTVHTWPVWMLFMYELNCDGNVFSVPTAARINEDQGHMEIVHVNSENQHRVKLICAGSVKTWMIIAKDSHEIKVFRDRLILM